MKLFMSVFLPLFSVELAKRRFPELNDEPLLIIERCTHRNKEIVLRASTEARTAGARPGMNLASARACLEEVKTLHFEDEYEAGFLLALAEWAIRFSPFVNTDLGSQSYGSQNCVSKNSLSKRTASSKVSDSGTRDPRNSGLYLDVSGQSRIFGGYEELVKKISGELARLGFSSRLAISPSYGASWALARYGNRRCYILLNKELLSDSLGELPTTALRTTKVLEDSLKQVNITKLKHLYSIKVPELNKRFDSSLSERLEICLGKKAEAAQTIKFEKKIEEKIVFEGPINEQASLLDAFRKCLSKLLCHLVTKEQKLRELLILVKPVRLPAQTKLFIFNQPSSDLYHIEKISLPWLEGINLGFGIEEIALSVEAKALISKLQTDYLYTDDSSKKDLGELIDRLSHSTRTAHLHLHQSYLPEESFSFKSQPQLEGKTPLGPPILRADRPPLLLEHPQLVKTMAMLPDHPPFSLTWKGQTYKLTEGSSAERISAEWWKNKSAQTEREYFRVRLEDGPWLWIYRQWADKQWDKNSPTEIGHAKSAQWFVHGIWT